jgi:pimeloyl-ACP methyl ester carboxylesterase
MKSRIAFLMIAISCFHAQASIRCFQAFNFDEKPSFMIEKTDLQRDLNNWLMVDAEKGVPPLHQRRLLIREDFQGPADVVVLMLHGLYNSPAWLTSIEDVFRPNGEPVMMSRLAGHFEKDSKALTKIEWQQWLNEAEADFQLAKRLGKKVVLVGHSTGALLMTWIAIKHSEDVQALALFSPAFGVHPLAQIGAWISKTTGFSPLKPDGKRLVGHAGIEVAKASLAFKNWLSEQSRENLQYAAERLSSVPIWIGNTKMDIVIQQAQSRDFFEALKSFPANPAKREDYWIPISKLVLHDAITTTGNKRLDEMKMSLAEFLRDAGQK